MDSRRHALKRAVLLLGTLAAFAGPATIAVGAEPGHRWISGAPGRPFSFPNDIAVDRRGVVFLLDSGNRAIALFSPDGTFVREISGRGAWRDPMAIAVSPDGMIFLADGDGGRVLEIEFSGKIRREYPAGRNARVTGVAFYGESVYCVDNRNASVSAFDRKGNRTSTWGRKGDQPGEFNAPFRIAVDGSGRVFVTDVMNARIQWFSPFGQHLGTLKRFGAGEGKIFRPAGIGIDSKGRIWVGDSYTGLVQLFEGNGTFVRSLGRDGNPTVFGDPVGVAEGPHAIWVADQREGKIALFPK